ncbi:hypothetical protein ACFX13_018770 [Malus domestica]
MESGGGSKGARRMGKRFGGDVRLLPITPPLVAPLGSFTTSSSMLMHHKRSYLPIGKKQEHCEKFSADLGGFEPPTSQGPERT